MLPGPEGDKYIVTEGSLRRLCKYYVHGHNYLFYVCQACDRKSHCQWCRYTLVRGRALMTCLSYINIVQRGILESASCDNKDLHIVLLEYVWLETIVQTVKPSKAIWGGIWRGWKRKINLVLAWQEMKNVWFPDVTNKCRCYKAATLITGGFMMKKASNN